MPRETIDDYRENHSPVRNLAVHFIVECERGDDGTQSGTTQHQADVSTGSGESSRCGGAGGLSQCRQFVQIIDTFTVISSQTRICNIVPEMLRRLDLAGDHRIQESKSYVCYVIMRNWKPLNVEYICDVTQTNILQLVGDFPNYVTLKIKFFRDQTPFCDTKNQVLTLLSQAQSLVRNGEIVSPLDERSIVCNNVTSGTYPRVSSSPTQCHDAINLSTRDTRQSASAVDDRCDQPIVARMMANRRQALCGCLDISAANVNTSVQNAIQAATSIHAARYCGAMAGAIQMLSNSAGQASGAGHSRMESIVENLYTHHFANGTHQHQHSGGVGSMELPSSVFGVTSSPVVTRRNTTRERITFDPAIELPILMKVFNENRHPTREQMEQLLRDLAPLRQGKKPLEVFNIQYWFKNARAMLKRHGFVGSGVQPTDSMDISNQMSVSPSNENVHGFEDLKADMMDSNTAVSGNIAAGFMDRVDLDDVCNSALSLNSYIGNHVDTLCNIGAEFYGTEEYPTQHQYHLDSEGTDIKRKSGPSPIRSTGGHIGGPNNTETIDQYRQNTSSLVSPGDQSTAGKYRRNRVFIDPTTEIPILEKWFALDTHPTSSLISTICDEINSGPYRAQYQQLKPRNVQLWFKNHRAKLKRVSGGSSGMASHTMHPTQVTMNSIVPSTMPENIIKHEEVDMFNVREADLSPASAHTSIASVDTSQMQMPSTAPSTTTPVTTTPTTDLAESPIAPLAMDVESPEQPEQPQPPQDD